MPKVPGVASPKRLQVPKLGWRCTQLPALNVCALPLTKFGACVINNSIANRLVTGTDDVAKEVDARVQWPESNVRLQAKLQRRGNESFYLNLPCRKLFTAFMHENEVVNVPNVALRFERVLHELIKFV